MITIYHSYVIKSCFTHLPYRLGDRRELAGDERFQLGDGLGLRRVLIGLTLKFKSTLKT